MIIENKPGVYMIECISTNKKLIGESGKVAKRISYHVQNLKGNRHENPYLQKAWNKYGHDNFVFTVLEYCKFDQCKIREDYYCRLYNTHNHNKGFNLRPTGKELKNKFSEELKKKMADACASSEKYKNRDCGKGMRGKHHSKETRKKIGDANRGRTHSEETKLKMSKSLKGRKVSPLSTKKRINSRLNNNKPWHTEEIKLKISNSQKGKFHSNECKKKMRLDRLKPVLQYDLQGNFIKEWPGALIVQEELGYSSSCINQVCAGNRKTHKNFIWKRKQT